MVPLIFAFVGAIAIGIVALHMVPLRGYAAKIERTMSGWLHDEAATAVRKSRAVLLK